VDPGEPVGPLLAFLTSGCAPCAPFWSTLDPVVEGRSVVIITPSPSTESRRAVAALARPELTVVMASEVWHAYGVTAASWVVLVDRGSIAAEGKVANWAGLRAMLAAPSH
jgi:hypothetical protein